MDADHLFRAVIAPLVGKPGITTSRMFGSTGVKVGGKVFAILVKGTLVVKLPRERVDGLVGSGAGERFDPGHGRPSKEWVALKRTTEAQWRRLPPADSNSVRHSRRSRSWTRLARV